MAKKKAASVTALNRNASIPKVDFTRTELFALLPAYYMIRDAVEGEIAVKGFTAQQSAAWSPGAGNGGLPLTVTNIMVQRAIRYLPMPNSEDQSPANIARYKAYVIRAVFYNASARTLNGMSGQVFLRDPDATIPPDISILEKNADGIGMSLDQVAERLVRHVIAYGRAGILVDYPVTTGETTKADLENGNVRPNIITYNPWDIINWRVEAQGAKKILTLVVLREMVDEDEEDSFALNMLEQYRVLRIDPDSGNHVVEVYRRQRAGGRGFTLYEAQQMPTDAKGVPLKEIPFSFVGSDDNEPWPNKPPLYDLVSINMAHYRNSADYEESCFLVGQPTPVASGLSEDWVTNVLKGSVALGSRSTIPLPVGAEIKLLQAEENSMPMEAMKAKESQMIALGAKLIQPTGKGAPKTATQQIIETVAESSPLAKIAKNCSAAIEWALGTALNFVSVNKAEIKYQLNKDFDLTSMTADDQNAVILQWQSGAISYEEMRTVLRRAGTATLTDEEARAGTLKDIEDGLIPDPSGTPEPGDTAEPPEPANDGGVPPKAKSQNGGPQPKRVRRQSKPGTTA